MKTEKNKLRLPHFHVHDHTSKMFTDEEARVLEKEFIEAYSGDSKSTLKILFRLYRRYPVQLILSVFFYVIATLPHVLTPLFTANLINAAVSALQDPAYDYRSAILFNVGLWVFFVLLNIPTTMLYYFFLRKVTRQVEIGLRAALVTKLQQLSIPFHKEMQSGRIQSKLMRDVDAVQSLCSTLFSHLPQILFNMVIALTVVISHSMTIFIFFLLTIPLAVLLVRLFRGKMRKANHEFRKGAEETSASLIEMEEMTEITRAHALEETEIHKITSVLNRVGRTGFNMDMLLQIFGVLSWIVFQLFQLICLVFSVYMAIKGNIEIGDISLYQSYFTTLTGQVTAIIGILPIITQGLESVSSIGEILGANDVEDNRGKKALPDFRGEYEFRDVKFSYEDDQPLLKGLNLKIRSGETIAIVGESGSGKSTMLNLILGFILPKEGQVLVDGVDLNEVDLRDYRKNLAVVPQSSVLFSGSIRENITYGMEEVSEERLTQILDAAQLTRFIGSLPHGVDTRLDEHGANLSGGQRQRLSIARALIRDPKVIILDEATSALDSVSEKEIQKAINNLAANRTMFIVAHRLSTIRNADRIAVIRDGDCVEIGTFDELMALKGEFYKMQTLQVV